MSLFKRKLKNKTKKRYLKWNNQEDNQKNQNIYYIKGVILNHFQQIILNI